jgi:hypothetical protein
VDIQGGVEKDEQRVVVSFAPLPFVEGASEEIGRERIAFLF